MGQIWEQKVSIDWTVFCRDCDFATLSLKKIICCIQNRLGAPFVVCKFAWGRILNMCAVSDCLSLTRSLFVLLTTLKQCIHLKWPLNILTTYLPHIYISSRIKHGFFPFFVNRSQYFPRKKNPHVVLTDWDYYSNHFSNFKVFLYDNYNDYFVNLQ